MAEGAGIAWQSRARREKGLTLSPLGQGLELELHRLPARGTTERRQVEEESRQRLVVLGERQLEQFTMDRPKGPRRCTGRDTRTSERPFPGPDHRSVLPGLLRHAGRERRLRGRTNRVDQGFSPVLPTCTFQH